MTDKRQYGIRKLTLLNSGGYSRGEFPLDRSVSISGPNNMGKTTVVNALQIPFLCDRREMSFPGSEKDTLKYYFPKANSFVVSEARTETGTFVVGAAGLGAAMGYEYQLFVYKKALNIEDFLYPHPGDENQTNVSKIKKEILISLFDKNRMLSSSMTLLGMSRSMKPLIPRSLMVGTSRTWYPSMSGEKRLLLT